MAYVNPIKRKAPYPDIDQVRDSILAGLLGTGMLVACGFVGVSRLLSGETRIDDLASLLGYLFAASIIIVWTGLCILAMASGILALFARRKWFRMAVTGQATVISRGNRYSEDQYGVITNGRYEFDLKVDHLPEQFVTLIVSERIYKKYAQGDRILVYYLAADPIEFVIKGE